MRGPQQFDPSVGDRREGPRWHSAQQAWVTSFPSVTLVPRERTQDSSGADSSSGLVRLTIGSGTSLPPDLTEDPTVTRIVPSTYTGHVNMYTNTKIMTVQERGNIPSTALPDFDL